MSEKKQDDRRPRDPDIDPDADLKALINHGRCGCHRCQMWHVSYEEYRNRRVMFVCMCKDCQ